MKCSIGKSGSFRGGWVRLLAGALRARRSGSRLRMGGEVGGAGGGSSTGAARGVDGCAWYGGDHSTAVATISTAADMIDRLPPGTGGARRREQRIDKVANRGTLIAILARGGHLAEARTQGEDYLAKMTDPASTPGELGAIGDAHSGLSMAYALQGEPGLARRSYAASVASISCKRTLPLVRGDAQARGLILAGALSRGRPQSGSWLPRRRSAWPGGWSSTAAT